MERFHSMDVFFGVMKNTPRRRQQYRLRQDATCAPAWVAFSVDVRLLAEAREKLEGMVDALWVCTGDAKRLRMYRRSVRKVYLRFAKRKKPSHKQIRCAVRQQLGYVRRNLFENRYC